MIIEICNDEIGKQGLRNAIADGWFMIWTPEKIKSAFAAGHGTMKDFERYKKDNSPKYCRIIDIEEAELAEIFPRLYEFYGAEVF